MEAIVTITMSITPLVLSTPLVESLKLARRNVTNDPSSAWTVVSAVLQCLLQPLELVTRVSLSLDQFV